MTPLERALDIHIKNKEEAIRPSSALANRMFWAFITAASLLLLLLILTPVAALLIHASPTRFLHLLADQSTLSALRVTAVTSTISTLLVFLLGLPVAYALSRYSSKGRLAVETLLELPMVMPPIVAGLALLLAFGRRGLVGALLLPFGIQIPFTLAAVVLTQVFIITPCFVKRTAVLFDGVDRQLETAAMLLGSGPFYTFFHITLPLCRRNLLAEVVMALAQGIGMFGAVILFAGNLPQQTQTLSLAIYAAFESDPEQAFLLSSLMLLISCLLLLAVRLLTRPRSTGRGHG